MHSRLLFFAILSLLIPSVIGASLPELSQSDLFPSELCPSEFSPAEQAFYNRPCAKPAVPGVPESEDFCKFPPVPPVSIKLYQGTWFQTYYSGIAELFSGGGCTTANYKLLPNNSLEVLDCTQRDMSKIPTCVRDVAFRRSGTTEAGHLQVYDAASPIRPGNPGDYNIAALLGSETYGYLAAAVHTCVQIKGRPNATGMFIISRTLLFKKTILQLLLKQLKCRGYDVSQTMKAIEHKGCKYFFHDTGFQLTSESR